jgi:hypothetical protein
MIGVNAVGTYGHLTGVLTDLIKSTAVMTTEVATECGPSSGAL